MPARWLVIDYKLNGYFVSTVLLTALDFQTLQTRKLSCRKDDRVMCGIYGRPEKFRESQSTPTTTFAEIFNVLFPIDSITVRIKFKVRSFTYSWDNRGYSKKLGSPWICPGSLFSQICNGILFGSTLWMYLPNLKCVVLPFPEIIVIAVLG